jgi:5-methylcytosine-specific restriction endonuclease McrA
MTRRLADLSPELAERQRAAKQRANRRWREAHPGPGRRPFPGGRPAYNAQYRKTHAAEHRAYMKAWRKANRDRLAAQKRAAYAANPARAIERANRWAEENPTRRRAIRIAHSANTRAADIGSQGRLSADGLDHVVPFYRGGTNTTGNIQNLCRSCNARKGTKLPEEMAA